MSKTQGKLGIVALLLGVIALALAIIPQAIFEVPPPWPTEPAAKPQHVTQGGKTFEWNGGKVTIGGTTKVVEPPPPPPIPAAAKVVFIATTIIGLAGIAMGFIAAWRERSYVLGGPAVALCSVALLWHYIVLGITIAVVVVFLIIILANLGNSLPR